MTGVHRGASQDVPLFVFFSLLDAVARREQGFGAVVPPHGLARGCTALAQGCNVVLSLRTLELVVARVAVVKGAPKFLTTQCASSSGCWQALLTVGREVR